MGRRENPIGECSKSLYALASWLRAAREGAGLTYSELASRTEYSEDTLARAAAGRSVPRRAAVVTAFAQACDADPREAMRLWKRARLDESRARNAVEGGQRPLDISYVANFAQLHAAMLDLYQRQGSPPYRQLVTRAGDQGRLSSSAISRVLRRQTVPSLKFLLAFVTACGVTRLRPWETAWQRANEDRRGRARRPRAGGAGLTVTLDVRERVRVLEGRATSRDLQMLMSTLELSAKRKRGLKLTVSMPGDKDATHTARVRAREMLLDLAHRSGELSCPRCNTTAAGYDNRFGWMAVSCPDCDYAPPLPRRLPGQHRGQLATNPPPAGSVVGDVDSVNRLSSWMAPDRRREL
jgi:transcriptional regulator with XRE-family HTH domain